jgi:hypothetical protein
MSPKYVSVADFKADIGYEGTEDKDALIELCLRAAENRIEEVCGRSQDGFVAGAYPTTRVYVGNGLAWLYIDQCVEVELVEVKESISDTSYTAWDADDWEAASGSPERPTYGRTPYELLVASNSNRFTSGRYGRQQRVPTVRVTARWGYAEEVPAALEMLVVGQAARYFQRLRGTFEDAIVGPEGGAILFRRMDADLQALLVNTPGFKVVRAG